MKKPFNLRIPVLIAVFYASGIVFSTLLVYFGADGIYLLVPTLSGLAACGAVALFKRNVRWTVIILFAVVAFFLGAIYLYVKATLFMGNDLPYADTVKITGRVCESGLTSGGKRYIILKGAAANGVSLGGKIYVSLSENAGDYCRRGYLVTYYSWISKADLISGGEIFYRAADDVRYFSSATGGLKAEYGFSLFGEIDYALENMLFDSLDYDTASVCYAMLTGNSYYISSGILDCFRFGGVAHIFAVSGLHVGIIFGAVRFLFKRMGVNRFVNTALSVALVTLYAGVCGFSPSSVRAVIMCGVFSLSGCFYRKYDGLNSLAISAFIILSVNPFYLYDVGFALSFSAMLGIVLLGPNLRAALGFLPRRLSGTLSVGWSAQFATLPALISSFKYASAAGFFLNVILVPLISVLFGFIFAVALICLIVSPIASTVMPIAAIPMQSVINLIVECGFENALVTADVGKLVFLPFIILTAGFTDKLNCGAVARLSFLTTALLGFFFMGTSGASYDRATVTFTSGYSGASALVTTGEGSVFIMTDNYEGRLPYLGDADSIVVVGDDPYEAYFALGVQFDGLYVDAAAFPLGNIGATKVINSDSFELHGITFTRTDGGITAEVEGVSLNIRRAQDGEWCADTGQSRVDMYAYNGLSAVVFTQDGDYGLDVCGPIRFKITNGQYKLTGVLPRE